MNYQFQNSAILIMLIYLAIGCPNNDTSMSYYGCDVITSNCEEGFYLVACK